MFILNMAFDLKLSPIILSSDIPSFLEIRADSCKVKGTSPRNLLYTASFPMYSVSINISASCPLSGSFSFIASMRFAFGLFVIIIVLINNTFLL